MGAPRGTTPDITCTFADPNLDLTTVGNVYATLEQFGRQITKTGADLEITAHTVAFSLTQEESLLFQPGDAEIQVNWTWPNGKRGASDPGKKVSFSKNLLGEVLE